MLDGNVRRTRPVFRKQSAIIRQRFLVEEKRREVRDPIQHGHSKLALKVRNYERRVVRLLVGNVVLRMTFGKPCERSLGL